ncbi:hypothetical protein [Clostridium sp. BNL1100]|uniref:hypothetical protein n=1 Tax=Clostridium sp. BNL1100 TaxID=755731 RepID=UPI000683660E|nr:hypothetical protein [Clostridium sp. BNL1100]
MFTREIYQLASDVYICGEIPSTHDFEEIPEGFFVGDVANKHIDMIKDEQMLIIRTNKGLCIFLGCSHPGIINCLTYVLKQFPGEIIDTVVGLSKRYLMTKILEGSIPTDWQPHVKTEHIRNCLKNA